MPTGEGEPCDLLTWPTLFCTLRVTKCWSEVGEKRAVVPEKGRLAHVVRAAYDGCKRCRTSRFPSLRSPKTLCGGQPNAEERSPERK